MATTIRHSQQQLFVTNGTFQCIHGTLGSSAQRCLFQMSSIVQTLECRDLLDLYVNEVLDLRWAGHKRPLSQDFEHKG